MRHAYASLYACRSVISNVLRINAHVFCPDRYHRPSGRYAPRTTHLFYVSFAREALSGRYARCITHTSYAVGS